MNIELILCIKQTFLSRNYSAKCAGCTRIIHSSDWVRRAKNHVYHLACFACDDCKRQLSTGEQFAMLENKVLCKTHYNMIEGSLQTGSGKEGRPMYVYTSMK